MADLGRYCKKPVEIEAVRWTGVNHDDLIRGVQGEFYPCKPEIFTQTYDPVGGGSDG